METIFKDEAIVLRKSFVGDFDLSITVYTRQTGKENIYIPKGQIIKSNLITATEPFNWFSGVFKYIKGKLYLQEIDTYRNLALPLAKDISRFNTAFDINFVFNRYVIFPDEKFFILLKKTLYYLSEGVNPEILKINFLVKLIYLSGIFPELDKCQQCSVKINQKNFSVLSIEKAGCLCINCSSNREKFNNYSILNLLKKLKNISFKNIQNINIQKKEIEKLDKFLNAYLSHHL